MRHQDFSSVVNFFAKQDNWNNPNRYTLSEEIQRVTLSDLELATNELSTIQKKRQQNKKKLAEHTTHCLDLLACITLPILGLGMVAAAITAAITLTMTLFLSIFAVAALSIGVPLIFFGICFSCSKGKKIVASIKEGRKSIRSTKEQIKNNQQILQKIQADLHRLHQNITLFKKKNTGEQAETAQYMKDKPLIGVLEIISRANAIPHNDTDLLFNNEVNPNIKPTLSHQCHAVPCLPPTVPCLPPTVPCLPPTVPCLPPTTDSYIDFNST